MRKNKTFITGAFFIVAICGAFATKAVNKLGTVRVWTKDINGSCSSTYTDIPPCTTETLDFTCKKDFGAGLQTVYQTTNEAGLCTNRYFTDIDP